MSRHKIIVNSYNGEMPNVRTTGRDGEPVRLEPVDQSCYKAHKGKFTWCFWLDTEESADMSAEPIYPAFDLETARSILIELRARVEAIERNNLYRRGTL